MSYLIITVAVEQHPQLLGEVPPPLPALHRDVIVVVIIGVLGPDSIGNIIA